MRGKEGINEREERGRRKAYTEVRKRRGKRKEMREGKNGNREERDGVAKRDETEEMYSDKRERG